MQKREITKYVRLSLGKEKWRKHSQKEKKIISHHNINDENL